jgi:hypothetical protein
MYTYIKFHAASKFGLCADRGQHVLNPTQADLDDAIAAGDRDGSNTLHIYCDRWADLKAWTEPGSYMGTQFYGFVDVAGQSRDSDTLESCNFERISEDLVTELKGEVYTDDGGEECSVVYTSRASHWAVGWVETVMVHYSSVKALDLAASIRDALSDYPVYDDCAFSEAEYEKQSDDFINWAQGDMERTLRDLFGERWTDTVTGSKAWDAASAAIWDSLCGYSGVEDAFPCERRLKAVLCGTGYGDIDCRLRGDVKALYLVRRIASALNRHTEQAHANY